MLKHYSQILLIVFILSGCSKQDSINAAPIANAGIDQTVITTSAVTLDCSLSSDANGDLLTYSWSMTSKPDGSTAILANSASANPTFVADIDGVYAAQLIVDDKTVNSTADNVNIYSFSTSSVKNIILLIGDGMGAEHIKAARWQDVGVDGILNMDSLSVNGWIRTGSADNLITDSAAASTAIATGTKTNNGVIGLDPSLNELSTILEEAKQQGRSVGLITTVQISHATPAAFASHVEDRSQMTEIALQLLNNNVDVLLGGGEDEFLPISSYGCFSEPGERNDGRNLIDEAIGKGYTYVCDSNSLEAIDPTFTNKLIGLFADEGMVRPFSPSLDVMAQKAIDILSQNPNGFFLVIEGGQIDWASHSNDAANAINDTVSFDKVVKVASEFTAMNGDTLIMVTADHETGGMSVSLNPTGYSSEDGPFTMPDGTKFYINWLTTGHTHSNIPIMSSGYNSNLFSNIHENTFIYEVMKNAFDK